MPLSKSTSMLVTISRYQKSIAWFFAVIMYAELLTISVAARASCYRYPLNSVFAAAPPGVDVFNTRKSANTLLSKNSEIRQPFKKIVLNSAAEELKKVGFGPGPSQPEMQAFSSVNANNMVDLFSGDFSYNIPLLDVGGYPVNIAYRSGVSMDQEASWVGLGWNINPGTISRNLRGLPDDFNGTDSIKKVTSIKENKTIGVTGGANLEVTGLPLRLGASLGVFHNNYKGWGLENSVNASINAGIGSAGKLTGGLSVTNNSQEGLTISPSLSVSLSQKESDEKSGIEGSFSVSLPYNSRTGIKSLQTSVGVRQFKTDYTNTKSGELVSGTRNASGDFSSMISFASPTAMPSINMPFTSRQYSFTAKVGLEASVVHPNFFISGYISKQQIDPQDTVLYLPAYGYLNSQNANSNNNGLLDFNREKELIYRDKPTVPNIGVPFYTYDAFSITGEGTGGMFRAYRSDIGYVHDAFMRTKNSSAGGSLDIGLGNLVHLGVDVNLSSSYTQNSAWVDQNSLGNVVAFRNNDTTFEGAYFRNPGTKSINSKSYYDALGGDDVVTVRLYQSGSSSSVIQATNNLVRYRNKLKVGNSVLTRQNVIKPERDKRSQVISYLTAKEADAAGLSKYIENYTPNNFDLQNCTTNASAADGPHGLNADYYPNLKFSGIPYSRIEDSINYNWNTGGPTITVTPPLISFPTNQFDIRWTGRIKAPVTGTYTFTLSSDDGVRFWLNDSLLINFWNDRPIAPSTVTVNLVLGQMYKLKIDYYEKKGLSGINFKWAYPGQANTLVPSAALYLPQTDGFVFNSNLQLERRVNSYRKESHISEIDVLNPDGRKYVYGIPVYNLRQKEATFSVTGKSDGNLATGLVKYVNGTDNSPRNSKGQDNYYNSEEVPAYAHSFLLTGILSPDYVDLTGNGISDDDLGDAVKFKYSKINGILNPYKWRSPYVKDSVTYNDGLKTDSRDDKGSYTYGEKELWYMHSIESKTMVATFVTETRLDLMAIDESGTKYNDNSARRLKEINLYTKADLLKNGASAKPIKTVHFDYTYELCKGVNKPINDSGKLTLKRIWFTYNNNQKIRQNPYVFNYSTSNPDYNFKSYDRWGNYKDPLQNPGSTTGNTISNAEYPYALQDSTLAAKNAAAWALDSINLPSGGSMKITYESDDYAYVQNKRAMQLLKLAGFGNSAGMTTPVQKLYNPSSENLYAYVTVPAAVSSKQDVMQKYLEGVTKLYFKLFVQMPGDMYGSGYEYIPCYATLDTALGVNAYGTVSGKPNMIWVKLKGVSLKGDDVGNYNPLAKAAIQFLRLNLPSKAYPGSQVGDNIDLEAAIRMIFAMGDNITGAFKSFDKTARSNSWAMKIDTSRSFIRLNNPGYNKYGGGHRVKRITIYDNWDKMTGGRAAKYGQEYTYKTIKEINGVNKTISSGVANWEPGIGGEENPFRQPIEYIEDISILGPVAMGYSEEPLGESLFPSPSVGYSKVRVRTINYKNIRSANGFTETAFYTAYDFPVYTDRTLLDNDTKKRFKPALSNFLRINAKYYMSMSQGFKIELNDMHGKLRSEATYAEGNTITPVTYTENIYKVENRLAEQKRLSNTVMAMKKDGSIDSSALIGKEVEIMMDMREQQSVTTGNNISVNSDMFAIPFIPPFFIIPSLLNLAQRQETRFRSVATTKIIQRYGIIDSIIHIDKGSKVTAQDLLYDAETGEVLLNRSQNEFNDPVYSFNYPAEWAYNGMGQAYKNIAAVASHVSFVKGKITGGLPMPELNLFSSGDELLVNGKQFTGTNGCTTFASFPSPVKIWAFDSAVSTGGPRSIYFMDETGKPYTGRDVSIKIIRSGRRNLGGSAGSVIMLNNPLTKNMAGQYQLKIDSSSAVINASVAEFKNIWQVQDRNKAKTDTAFNVHSCPVGYTFSLPYNACIRDTAIHIDTTFTVCLLPSQDPAYTSCGSFIYSSFNVAGTSFTRSKISLADTFWVNTGSISNYCSYDPAQTAGDGGQTMRAGATDSKKRTDSIQALQNKSTTNAKLNAGMSTMSYGGSGYTGPLNRTGVWSCTPSSVPANTWFGFTVPIYIPHDGLYYLGMGADNLIRVTIDGTIFRQDANAAQGENFKIWHIFPKFLTAGLHSFKLDGQDDGSTITGFGFELYDNTESELRSASSYNGLNLIFSTKDVINQTYPSSYSCPVNYQIAKNDAGAFVCRSIIARQVDTFLSVSCRSVVRDTIFNPYANGVLGNWRNDKAYVYYSNRKETDPNAEIDTRKNGVINNFASFWSFQNGDIAPSYDTSRWVWNSRSTMFNKKGFELENQDPLGRYNAALYGYSETMPVAIIQNSQYRELAFDGFEDYGFTTRVCDTSCPAKRHIDYSAYAGKISSIQKHSGKSSIKLNAGESVTIGFGLVSTADDTLHTNLAIATASDVCSAVPVLASVKAGSSFLQPLFSPLKGRKMMVSAWVKEEQDCNSTTYTNNKINILFNGGPSNSSVDFYPSGAIIEGWQRYEGVFNIPNTEPQMLLTFQATGPVAAYFDDLRIQPFNANMKSFVYNPVNLRLMAELDENNYATFYEYDDDGTVVRVKKETEKGIQTIKETRSALIKQ